MEGIWGKEKMKLERIFSPLVLIAFLSFPVHASLEISVATDKTVYQPGETVEVYVSLYNPTSESVTLTHGSSLEVTYLMDQSYYWHLNVHALDVITYRTIQPEQTVTWQLNHDDYHQSYYSLDIGYHSVQGGSLAEELGGLLSEPVEFQVIPEPATILLLTLGIIVYLITQRIDRHRRM